MTWIETNSPTLLQDRPTRSLGWHERAKFLVESLPGFLSWTKDLDLVRSACEIHEKGTLGRLLLWAQAAGPEIQNAFAGLPKLGQERLLRAPYFLFFLRSTKSPAPEHLQKYYRFLAAEAYLCGRTGHAPTGWTALGDRYFLSEDSRLSFLEKNNPLCSRHASQAEFFETIMIDAWSPYMQYCWISNQGLGEAELYTPEEVELVRRRLEESLDYIRFVSPVIAEAVLSSVHVIGAAKGRMNPDVVVSMSIRLMIGDFILANLLSAPWKLGEICDAIVHETIHAIIYRLELLNPLLIDRDSSAKVQVTSPWSGRSLDLYSFVHACFVWFGLWNFWNMPGHRITEAADLRNRAGRGFLQIPVRSLLSPEISTRLRSEVVYAIEEMFEVVSNNFVMSK